MIRKIALKLIHWLSQFTYKPIMLAEHQHLVEPVMDENGTALVLEYLGKKRQMYRYKNESDMIIGRSIFSKFFEAEKEMGVNRKFISDTLSKTIESNDKDNKSQVGFNLLMMKDCVEHLTPLEVLLNQASIFYFDEEEDLKNYDADRHKAKVAAMRKHPDQGFFLRMLLKDLGISGDQRLADIQRSLRESEVKLRAYRRVVSDQEGS